jgi:hypothetical protein
MNQENRLEIIDENGWRKEFPLERNLIHIGSDARNDIVLESWRGTGVAPRHLQLVAIPGAVQGYRTINLGAEDIPLGESGDQVLSPRSTIELADGQRFELGTFTLVFRLGGVGPSAVTPVPVRDVARPVAAQPLAEVQDTASDVIGLRFSLPSGILEPERPLEGIVTVRNSGKQPGVQFRLEVEGLEPDCYEIGPGPILFPNVEKGVFLRLNHPRRPDPPAGHHQIRIRASAPEAYPGESAIVSKAIEILPYYEHMLRILTVD